MFNAAPMTLGNSLGYYSGIFSTAVTASVNPTATMAALATLGAIENASIYSPDSAFFNTIADSLNSIPVINAAASLPIANPYAAVFLTIVAAIMIILHSFAESKIVSQATIDKLDKLSGWIGVTALSLLPLVTNEGLEKNAGSAKHAGRVIANRASEAASGGAPWYVWVIGLITLVIASIVYFCLYDCVDNIGTICAAIPVKGLNIVEQIIKALLHAGMILLQITFPIISFIISIILAILGILLFKVLARITFYYKEVYIRPILHRIFRNGKPISLIHKKLPRRIRKRFPEARLTVPCFVFKGIAKTKTRSVIWFVLEGNETPTAHLMRKKSWGRCEELSIEEIKQNYPSLAIVPCKRFYELKTGDKLFNIVISKSYTDFIGDVGLGLGVPVATQNAPENAKAGSDADLALT